MSVKYALHLLNVLYAKTMNVITKALSTKHVMSVITCLASNSKKGAVKNEYEINETC